MSGPYGFTSWNYGYTLCPQTGSQFYQPPNAPRGFVPRGRGGGRGQHFSRGSRGGQQHQPQPKEVKVESQEVKAEPPAEVKAETAAAGPTSVVGPPSAVEANNEKEEGEIVERPIEEILRGRNAVMYCNDQSKMVNICFVITCFRSNDLKSDKTIHCQKSTSVICSLIYEISNVPF